jgi:hypothetical protein
VPAVPDVLPQLVANDGLLALQAAIADPERFAVEPKVDGVRGLVVFDSDGTLQTRNRRGIRRDWLQGDAFDDGLRRLGDVLPILWRATVIDGELTAGRFRWTMAALLGSKRYRSGLRFSKRGRSRSDGAARMWRLKSRSSVAHTSATLPRSAASLVV